MTSEGQHAGQQPAEATSGGQAEPFGDEGFPPDSDGTGRAPATPAAGFPTSYAPPPHATPNGGSPFVVPTVFGQPGAPQPPGPARSFPDAPADRYGIPTAQPGQGPPAEDQPQSGQLQPGQAHPGLAQVPDRADRTTPPPFAPPAAGAARAPAPGEGPALPQRTSSLPQRTPSGSAGPPPSAWAPPPVPPASDDPFGRPAEAHPYRSDDQGSGFTGFAPGSPTRARAGFDDPDSDQPAAPLERPGSLADGPSSGSPFARSSGSAFERPSAGSAFERPSPGSAFERPAGSPEFGSGQPPAPLGRPGSLPERPTSGATDDRPPGLSAFGDQRVRVPGATLTGLPDAPTSGRGGQPDETPGALPSRTPTGPDAAGSSPLPRRGGALPVRGQSGPADESPFGALRDSDADQAYRPGAAQPFGEPPAQPFGESPAQPFGGGPAAQPYETERPSSGSPQQYGRPATGDSVFGQSESPFGQPSGDQVFGRAPSSEEHPYARPTSDAGSPFAPPAAGGPISGGPTSGGSIFGGSAAAAQASPGQVPGTGREESGASPGPIYGRPEGSAFGAGQPDGSAFGAGQDDRGFGADEERTRFGGDGSRGAGGSGPSGGSLFGGFVPRGTSPDDAERSSFGPTADRPAFGTTPDGPPFGTTPDGPAFGATPDRPAFGTTPGEPAFGATPDRPVFGPADDGPAFGSNGAGGGLSSPDDGFSPSGYSQRVPGASFAASGMPVGTDQRNGSVPQPRDPAEPPATGSARAVSASASVPTASRVDPVDPDEVPPPVAVPQARVYGRPAQPSEPDDDAERPEPGGSAYPGSAGPASPAPGRVAGRATASARVALPGSEPGPPFTEPTADAAGRGRPSGPEVQPGMVQPGAPLPPDRYGENTTDISHRGADPTYVPAPAVSSMHARPPLEHGFPPAPDADQGFERPDRPRMGGVFPGPQSGPSVAPPIPDQTSSWPGVPAQVPDDQDQGRFEQFRPEPEAPPARPETPHVRMLPIIISVIVGAALLVGLAIGIVWLISRGSDSGAGISVAAGECVKRSGDEAIKAQCGDSGVFQVVSIADTKEQCADQAQPYVLNPTKDGKTQVLCLKPSS